MSLVQMLTRTITLIAVALAATSCASVLSGSTQLVTVMSEPSGANCTLSRDGRVVGQVISTPQAIKIDKSMKDMNVKCEREGYEETTVAMRSTHDAWSSAGNVLAWGILFPIAMGVDAASGAMNEYPDSVLVRLNPRSFASAEDRDRHYDQLKSQIESEAAAAVTSVKNKCKASDGCKADIGKIEAARDAELAALEEKRLRAIVPDAAPAAAPAATDAPTVAAPAGSEPTPPVAAAEDPRRQEIEIKWAARVESVRQLYCTGDQGDKAPECLEKVALVEAQRDAELQSLAPEEQTVQ